MFFWAIIFKHELDKKCGTRKFPASKTIFRVFKVFDATSDDCLKFPLPLHLKIVAYGGKTVM
jgi:hypothetical protein